MFNKLSNKELVTVTHDLAKTLSADAQFLDVAKLLAESATRLDVALTRANELLRKAEEAEALMLAMRDDTCESRSKLELLAAENAAMKAVFGTGEAVMNFLTIALRHTTYDEIDIDDVALAFKLSLPDVPATDAMVNEIRAEGVELFAQEKIKLRDGHAVDGNSEMVKANDYCAMSAEEFANQLRAGAAKDGE